MAEAKPLIRAVGVLIKTAFNEAAVTRPRKRAHAAFNVPLSTESFINCDRDKGSCFACIPAIAATAAGRRCRRCNVSRVALLSGLRDIIGNTCTRNGPLHRTWPIVGSIYHAFRSLEMAPRRKTRARALPLSLSIANIESICSNIYCVFGPAAGFIAHHVRISIGKYT